MWFRRQHRPERDLVTWGEAYLRKKDVDGSAALPPKSYSVDDAPNGEPPIAEPNAPAGSMQLLVRYWHTRLFKPARRKLARDLVIGAGAPSEVYSAFNHLRTQIIERLLENGWNSVAITSPSRE